MLHREDGRRYSVPKGIPFRTGIPSGGPTSSLLAFLPGGVGMPDIVAV